jgi:uncharacterized protein (DUF169 family)
MRDYERLERVFVERLGLKRRPVAIAIHNSPPPDVPRLRGAQPSGCSFWRLAAEGQAFCTLPEDHYNCPIGSYTHNIPLPPERQSELDETLGLMVNLGYLRLEEVPAMTRLPKPPGAIVYAPLAATPSDPDVVLFAGQPGRMMLLQEAALRAGGLAALPLISRPTCMAVPAALSGNVIASMGCMGNRVYTGVDDGELYLVIPGKHVFRIGTELETIAEANQKLAEHHQARVEQLRPE